MTRRRHVVRRPTSPTAPSWTPAPGAPPYEDNAIWQGAAAPVARGIPRYVGNCLWRRIRNRQLIAQYGREQP